MDHPTRRLQLLMRRFATLARRFDASPEAVQVLQAVISSFDPAVLQHFLPNQFSRMVTSVINTTVKDSSGILYADVYQDSFCHVNTFGMLRAGQRIPLHDHPNQYAVMKVFQGSVKIRSFSIVSRDNETDSSDVDSCSDSDRFVTTKYQGETILSSRSGQHCAILGPHNGNIHEVVSLEPHTYFCDFFLPTSPSCNYYRSIDSAMPGQIVHLKRISCPREFYCKKMSFPSVERFDQIE